MRHWSLWRARRGEEIREMGKEKGVRVRYHGLLQCDVYVRKCNHDGAR